MGAENLYQPYEILYKETNECQKPAHKHNFFELVYIIDGTGTHCINKNKFTYRKGNLFLITPKDFHRLDVDTTTKFLFIRFTDIYLKAQQRNQTNYSQNDWIVKLEFIFNNTNHSPGCILKNMHDKILVGALIEGIVNENVNQHPYHQEIVQQIVNTLISIVARNIYLGMPDNKQFDSNADESILNIIHYIQNNIYDPELLKAEKLAGHFSLSVNYLGEYFKKHTGESLHQYIINHKLKLVETRLLYSNLRINEIALELNFTDESHLNRIFKKYKGVSPSDFRRKNIVKREELPAA